MPLTRGSTTTLRLDSAARVRATDSMSALTKFRVMVSSGFWVVFLAADFLCADVAFAGKLVLARVPTNRLKAMQIGAIGFFIFFTHYSIFKSALLPWR